MELRNAVTLARGRPRKPSYSSASPSSGGGAGLELLRSLPRPLPLLVALRPEADAIDLRGTEGTRVDIRTADTCSLFEAVAPADRLKDRSVVGPVEERQARRRCPAKPDCVTCCVTHLDSAASSWPMAATTLPKI